MKVIGNVWETQIYPFCETPTVGPVRPVAPQLFSSKTALPDDCPQHVLRGTIPLCDAICIVR